MSQAYQFAHEAAQEMGIAMIPVRQPGMRKNAEAQLAPHAAINLFELTD